MGVQTTSDEKREQAREKLDTAVKLVKEAQELVSEAVDRDTWGANELNSEYTDALQELEVELVQSRLELIRKRNKI
jgi:hypothetical protein